MKKFILTFICAFPLVGLSADFAEVYDVTGFDPVSNVHYTGTVVISKQDHVYTLNWTFDNGTHDIGTGLHEDDLLSVTFQEVENPSVTGVQVYKFKGSHILEGPWVNLGDTRIGHEKLTKSSCGCSGSH